MPVAKAKLPAPRLLPFLFSAPLPTRVPAKILAILYLLLLSACASGERTTPLKAKAPMDSEPPLQASPPIANSDASPVSPVTTPGTSQQTTQTTVQVPVQIPTPASEPFNPNAAYQVTKAGEIRNSKLPEISGLAANRSQSGLLWAINDSGGSAELHAINSQGQLVQSVLTDVDNRDWEDLASFSLAGENFLLLAETGDNLAHHADYSIYLFLEPVLSNSALQSPYTPIKTIRFRYADGPHDAEAVAVSESEQSIYIITKKNPAGLYRLNLDLPVDNNQASDLQIAARVITLPGIQQSAADLLLGALAGVDLSSITAFDLDEARNTAWMMTYRGVYSVGREASEDWASALQKKPTLVHTHNASQGEALSADAQDGSVWFTSERLPAPLWRITRQ